MKTVRLILTLTIAAAGFNTAFAADNYQPNLSLIFNRGVQGMYNTVSDSRNRILFIGGSAMALAAYSNDANIAENIRSSAPLSHNLLKFCDNYGEWAGSAMIAVMGIGTIAQIAPLEVGYDYFEYAGLSLAATSGVTGVLKLAIGRERPNGKNNRSFPSGHTSHSFAAATIISEIYGNKPGAAAYAIASLVAVSRIQEEAHYLSDVIFGAAIGVIIPRSLALAYREDNLLAGRGLYIKPALVNGAPGISMQLKLGK